MPSQHYLDNWEETNKWLQENAPPLVIKCIAELTKTLLDQNLLLMKLESRFHKNHADFAEVQQGLSSLKATLEERQKILDEFDKDSPSLSGE